MPSFGDSIFIFVLALMLFGPKKLPQLARQLGKLMAEFRRASNEFRMQMEDELRIADQEEHQKKVDALQPPPSQEALDAPSEPTPIAESGDLKPIAESGEIKMMPPSTGLPVGASTTSWDDMASSNAGVIASPTPAESSETASVSEHSIHTEDHVMQGEASHG